MLLSARMLDQVGSVNIFSYVEQFQFTEGDAFRVYFQLTDAATDRATQGFNPSGRRYMPVSGATLQITLDNIDDAKKVTRAAVQAFPTSDPSIWYLDILSTDAVRGTVNMLLQLTEAGKVLRGRLNNALGGANQGCL
jgi:hypothetical protein